MSIKLYELKILLIVVETDSCLGISLLLGGREPPNTS